MKYQILGSPAVPDMPWQEKPADCGDIPVWRYTENPIIGRNPIPGVARVFNSAVAPYGDGFIGVFRGEQKDGISLFIWAAPRTASIGTSKRRRFIFRMRRERNSCRVTPMIPGWSELTAPII